MFQREEPILSMKNLTFDQIIDDPKLDLIKKKLLETNEYRDIKDDIFFLTQQLETIRNQRDCYKKLLDEKEKNPFLIKNNLEENNQDFSPNFKSLETKNHMKNSLNECAEFILEPLNPESLENDDYGYEIGDHIDKLNNKIKLLKQVINEKSIDYPSIEMNSVSDIKFESPSSLNKKSIVLNNKRKRRNSLNDHHNSKENPKLWGSYDFRLRNENKSDNFVISHEHQNSIINIQKKFAVFPKRIRELEQKNQGLNLLIQTLKKTTNTNKESTVSLDRKNNNKNNFLYFEQFKQENHNNFFFDKERANTFCNHDSESLKKTEIDKLTKQLDEKAKELDLREKELIQKEEIFKNKETLLSKNDNKQSITLSEQKNHYNHYQDEGLSKSIMKDKRNNNEDAKINTKDFSCKFCIIM